MEKSMDALLKLIADMELPLIMDEPTPGKGNCFFAALCQQMRRPEVGLENLYTVQSLRRLTCEYAMSDKDERVNILRENYEVTASKPWNIFFSEMRKNGIYAEGPLVFVCAYMLGRNIIHISSSNKNVNPWYLIQGANEGEPHAAPIILGNISNVHFQSFLPTNAFDAYMASAAPPDQLSQPPARPSFSHLCTAMPIKASAAEPDSVTSAAPDSVISASTESRLSATPMSTPAAALSSASAAAPASLVGPGPSTEPAPAAAPTTAAPAITSSATPREVVIVDDELPSFSGTPTALPLSIMNVNVDDNQSSPLSSQPLFPSTPQTSTPRTMKKRAASVQSHLELTPKKKFKTPILREFKALKGVGEGVTDRVKKLELAVKAAFDAQVKDLEDFKTNMMSGQNELVSMMVMSVQSMVADINVLLNENRKLHATVGSVKCHLEVVEKDYEALCHNVETIEREKAALEKESVSLALANNELQEELQASKFDALLGGDDADDESFFESSLNLPEL